MSRVINVRDEFDIGDIVSFDHENKRLLGKIVRVYNTRDVYHVLVDGIRYEIDYSDNPRREI